ncbi:MAG TPA: YeeE/YedE thiosulfate transporter family protein [Methanoregulaceae archaeon]|nr:YeeE/YedE thiosulfate transporter family protein [Methanoregulaceae archaeon]
MDLKSLHTNRSAQVLLGLLFGIVFGFLLQKGGATSYEVIMGQLLLTDFTVVKIMASAVAVGLVGFFILNRIGYARRHVREGTIGSNVVGGLIFGLGFGLLGYCPGTVAGAVGQGALDALIGGFVGILIGVGIFARIYPSLNRTLLTYGRIKKETVHELLGLPEWLVVLAGCLGIVVFLYLLEVTGF